MGKFTGTVYLIHLKRNLKHAGHYLGFTQNEDVTERLNQHKSGTGAKILRAARAYGIDFECVRTWTGTRRTERELKNRHDAKSLCPLCREERNAAKMFSKAMRKLGVRRVCWR